MFKTLNKLLISLLLPLAALAAEVPEAHQSEELPFAEFIHSFAIASVDDLPRKEAVFARLTTNPALPFSWQNLRTSLPNTCPATITWYLKNAQKLTPQERVQLKALRFFILKHDDIKQIFHAHKIGDLATRSIIGNRLTLILSSDIEEDLKEKGIKQVVALFYMKKLIDLSFQEAIPAFIGSAESIGIMYANLHLFLRLHSIDGMVHYLIRDIAHPSITPLLLEQTTKHLKFLAQQAKKENYEKEYHDIEAIYSAFIYQNKVTHDIDGSDLSSLTNLERNNLLKKRFARYLGKGLCNTKKTFFNLMATWLGFAYQNIAEITGDLTNYKKAAESYIHSNSFPNYALLLCMGFIDTDMQGKKFASPEEQITCAASYFRKIPSAICKANYAELLHAFPQFVRLRFDGTPFSNTEDAKVVEEEQNHEKMALLRSNINVKRIKLTYARFLAKGIGNEDFDGKPFSTPNERMQFASEILSQSDDVEIKLTCLHLIANNILSTYRGIYFEDQSQRFDFVLRELPTLSADTAWKRTKIKTLYASIYNELNQRDKAISYLEEALLEMPTPDIQEFYEGLLELKHAETSAETNQITPTKDESALEDSAKKSPMAATPEGVSPMAQHLALYEGGVARIEAAQEKAFAAVAREFAKEHKALLKKEELAQNFKKIFERGSLSPMLEDIKVDFTRFVFCNKQLVGNYLATIDSKWKNRVDFLLYDISTNGRRGSAEALSSTSTVDGKRLLSRRINQSDRLVYAFGEDGKVQIYQIAGHYND